MLTFSDTPNWFSLWIVVFSKGLIPLLFAVKIDLCLESGDTELFADEWIDVTESANGAADSRLR